MSRPAQNKISLIGNLDRGVDKRLIALSQTNF